MLSPVLPKRTFLIFGLTLLGTARTRPITLSKRFTTRALLLPKRQIGHTRPGLTPRALRFWTLTRYPNYTIVYRPETAPLQIVAVLQGKRNIRRILKQRP
jgi:plasmid stabilization system protein ParE